MHYMHPDVLDNGPAYTRANAVRALVVPNYTQGMSYAQAVASALVSATISSADFTLSDEGLGRKLVFGGATVAATGSTGAGQNLHIAFTDGAARLLWVVPEATHMPIIAGQNYKFPAITDVAEQPAEA